MRWLTRAVGFVNLQVLKWYSVTVAVNKAFFSSSSSSSSFRLHVVVVGVQSVRDPCSRLTYPKVWAAGSLIRYGHHSRWMDGDGQKRVLWARTTAATARHGENTARWPFSSRRRKGGKSTFRLLACLLQDKTDDGKGRLDGSTVAPPPPPDSGLTTQHEHPPPLPSTEAIPHRELVWFFFWSQQQQQDA
ncbi:hypothetical protein LX32DRAFT_39787 [Colletotrichum zoysiae]|uniref:Uncharacterized protein n=1 Tax=Colletotrichum zoysiae TaxID=1216348 RepID=A0AAD9HBN4_9PEZI|nr:hypothetical protein LX32DRAFT_39787 [Colletotrichum zoysiae]